MAGVRKSAVRVLTARTLSKWLRDQSNLEEYDATSYASRAYLGIGRTDAWAVEATPPTPVDTIDEEDAFWTDLEGIQLISNTSGIQTAVKRVDWQVGATYRVFDESAEDAYDVVYDAATPANTDTFYIFNPETAEVFSIQSVETSGATSAGEMPDGTGKNLGETVVVDGVTGDYTYKLEYRLTQSEIANMLTPNWIPISNDEARFSLGAFYVQIGLDIPPTDATYLIPDNISYRQIAIMVAPKLTGGSYCTAASYLPASLSATKSGHFVYLQNAVAIPRSSTQSERIKIVLTV